MALKDRSENQRLKDIEGQPAVGSANWAVYPDWTGTKGYLVTADQMDVNPNGTVIFSSNIGGTMTVVRVFSASSFAYIARG